MKKTNKLMSAACAMLALAAIVSCQKDNSNVTISFDKDTFYTMEGEEFTIGYETSSEIDLSKINWTSSDTKVVAIENGTAKIKGYGEVTITASVGGGAPSSIKVIAYADLFSHQWYSVDDSGVKWIDIFKKTGEGKGLWDEFEFDGDKISPWSSESITYTIIEPGKIKLIIDGRDEDIFNFTFTAPDKFTNDWDGYIWYSSIPEKDYILP